MRRPEALASSSFCRLIWLIIRRSLGAFVVLIVVSFITFVIFQLAPFLSHTSPVYYYVGKIAFKPGSLQLKLLEHRYGFDLPWYQQYWHWLHGILFGQTLSDGTMMRNRSSHMPTTTVHEAMTHPVIVRSFLSDRMLNGITKLQSTIVQ